MDSNSCVASAVCAAVISAGLSSSASAESLCQIAWSQQIGTAQSDESLSVAVDAAGNAYITGSTEGGLAGTHVGEEEDGFLVKYDASGSFLWSRQLGTTDWDESVSVAVDSAGNAYITGATGGNLGGMNLGGSDAFLIKHDPSGSLLWSLQIGTEFDDEGRSVAVDGSNNIYVSGNTEGSLGGANAGHVDTFLSKYNASGNLLWSRQFGTFTADVNSSVAVDVTGNAYITGHTFGDLVTTNAGYWDCFLYKYDTAGNLLWSRQLGTAYPDASYSVAVDVDGNAFIAGITVGNLGGPNAGDSNAFLTKFDSAGSLLWSQQIGAAADVTVDAAGHAYVIGATTGSVGDINSGNIDLHFRKNELG